MAVYYSSLDDEEKKKKLKLWKDNAIQLMIATNAFGNLVQETGKAGRDRNSAIQAESVRKINVKSDTIRIVEVYCHLKCDNEELISIKIYNEKQEKYIRIKADAQHLLDWLIIRGVVKGY
ncbi:13787_t:CDS:2 [Funneliformis caledonium]|uniref:13787_t:CDS:1 n=1 Tax=Funneliformis caledonium TaxID=1117310 RepID=A0A9N9GSQ2_9GLOM|nr:13787_t:CDS:2 [Funneliformis caledonium]